MGTVTRTLLYTNWYKHCCNIIYFHVIKYEARIGFHRKTGSLFTLIFIIIVIRSGTNIIQVSNKIR